jgi:hypothetical protein
MEDGTITALVQSDGGDKRQDRLVMEWIIHGLYSRKILE